MNFCERIICTICVKFEPESFYFIFCFQHDLGETTKNGLKNTQNMQNTKMVQK